MVFLEVAELILSVLFFILFVTQVIIPIWQGEKLCPYFRRKRVAIDREMAKLKEEQEVAELEKQLEEMKKKVEKKKAESHSTEVTEPAKNEGDSV